MIRENYLNRINNLNKPFAIYKTAKGFDFYTDFSKKIILNNKNIKGSPFIIRAIEKTFVSFYFMLSGTESTITASTQVISPVIIYTPFEAFFGLWNLRAKGSKME